MQLPEYGHTTPTTTPHTRDGGHSGGETPGPIPNPEAKPSSADGTAPARVWDSTTPPNTTPPPQGAPTQGPLCSAMDERIATVSAGKNKTGDAERNNRGAARAAEMRGQGAGRRTGSRSKANPSKHSSGPSP